MWVNLRLALRVIVEGSRLRWMVSQHAAVALVYSWVWGVNVHVMQALVLNGSLLESRVVLLILRILHFLLRLQIKWIVLVWTSLVRAHIIELRLMRKVSFWLEGSLARQVSRLKALPVYSIWVQRRQLMLRKLKLMLMSLVATKVPACLKVLMLLFLKWKLSVELWVLL